MSWYTVKDGVIEVEIKAAPGASNSECAGVQDGRLRVRVAAPPEDGKANRELCRFVAKALGCKRSAVTLLRGEKSRLKTLAVPLACRGALEKIPT